ncbi:hypothetical protein EIKCOROL_01052 [Eikenella corrodens ATCC 23834]|uniref:Uncharacterized protein n=1 Tax=Eikenella corrodens ATCC 23834 TaxID=546274 RepID=C0DUL8_EIKCO|nr:hypothetical protein EIKCOROL_01052 [Eikenella corrodens ATCC 23834]
MQKSAAFIVITLRLWFSGSLCGILADCRAGLGIWLLGGLAIYYPLPCNRAKGGK